MASGDKPGRNIGKPLGLVLAAILALLALSAAARAQYPAFMVFGRILTAAPPPGRNITPARRAS
jgi:hypothetical protein